MRASLSHPMDYAEWGGKEAFPPSTPANDRGTATSHRSLTLWLLLIPVLGATFVSKFAVPGIHVDGISMGFPLIYLALTIGTCVAGNVRLEPARLFFFCLMAAVIGSFTILQEANVSLPSLAFLMLLHLPYVVRLEGAEQVTETLYRFF